MKRLMSGALILAAVFALEPLQVAAQQGQRARQASGQMMRRGGRWMGGGAGGGVAGLMRMRKRLNLTNDQFRKLDQIRAEVAQRRAAHLGQMIELRSKVMAGEATRGALLDSMTAWRKSAVPVRKAQRARVEAILTQAQKDTLKTIIGRRRAFAAGRASAFRGRMRQHMWRNRGGFMPGRGGAFRQGRGPGGPGMMRGGRMMGRGGGFGWMGPGSGPPPDSGNASAGGGGGF